MIRSIKFKVLVVGILLIASAIALLTTRLYFNARNSLEEVLSQEHFAAASRLAAMFDNGLTIRRDALQRVAESVPTEAFDHPAKLQQFLNERIALASLFPSGLSVIAQNGETLADLPVNAGRRGTNVSNRAWFQAVKASNQTLVAEPYVGGATRRPVLVIAAPLGKNTEFRGALVATLYLDQSNFFVDVFSADASGSDIYRNLYVISEKSRLFVASRDPARIMDVVSAPGQNVMADRYMAGYEGSGLAISSKGIEEISASKRMTTVPWHVVVATATHVVFKPVDNFAQQALLWGLAVSALVSFALWLLVSHVLRPVEQASRIIKRALGNPAEISEPIPTGGNDEIGTLLLGFSQLQDSLREKRQELDTILDNSSVGISFVKDRQQRWANRRMSQMFGYTLAEMKNKSTRMLYVSQEDYETVGKQAYRILASGKRYNEERKMLHRDGHSLWVRLSGTAISPQNLAIGSIWVLEDISEQKQLEAELEQHRHQLEALVEQRTVALAATEAKAIHILNSSADGLYGLSLEGKITFINQAACALLGYLAEQVIGRSAHTLFHHSKLDGTPYPEEACPGINALRLGQNVRIDNEVFWHADGHAIPVMYATHPMLQDGQISGAVTSFVDMSLPHAAAQARERALIAAENLARARSEFLSNMSHELRTPLNGVLGFADIGYRHAENSEKARDAFVKIKTSGNRLLAVINDVLDFSNIDTGKLHLQPSEVSLIEIIDHAVELVRDRAQAKRLTLRVEQAPNFPPRSMVDPVRLEQILLNLLSNAVKFTEAGSITVLVARQGEQLVFRVSDTGIGMNAEQLGLLFNPFQQADPSATRRYGGTGLGLAISKRILDLMSGNIRVESQPGLGSTVEFQLPYVASVVDV